MIQFLVDLIDVRGEIRSFRTVLEIELRMRIRETVKNHLLHGELVEVGVQ